MSEVPRPQVSDPNLRQVLEEVGPHIENYHTNLDTISNDIKSIEQYLSSSGIRMAASVKIGHNGDVLADGDLDEFGSYAGAIYRDVERIEWAPISPDDDRWRVMWVQNRKNGYLELTERIAIVGPTFNGTVEELVRKPLIETAVSVRLRAHRHLATLVRDVGKMVEVTHLTDEIPF